MCYLNYITKNKKININLILLLAGGTVSVTGTSIQVAVMPLYIIDAGGSAATIGLYSFFLLVPPLIVSPFAGVLGDRHNRKIIMVSTNLACGAAVLLLAFLAHSGSLTLPLLFWHRRFYLCYVHRKQQAETKFFQTCLTDSGLFSPKR